MPNLQVNTDAEAAMISSLAALYVSYGNGNARDFVYVLGTLVATRQAMTAAEFDAFLDRIYAIPKEMGIETVGSLSDLSADTPADALCEHCECESDECCWCGRSKSALVS